METINSYTILEELLKLFPAESRMLGTVIENKSPINGLSLITTYGIDKREDEVEHTIDISIVDRLGNPLEGHVYKMNKVINVYSKKDLDNATESREHKLKEQLGILILAIILERGLKHG